MEYTLSEQAYIAFSRFLHEKLGILLGANRQYLVKSRLSNVAREKKFDDFDRFLSTVAGMQDRELTDHCLELMTTNETFWFRDEYPFALLKKDILPSLLEQAKKLNKQHGKLRIWSSACSSGQEPYSIAMIVNQFMRENPVAFLNGVEIVATDYSAKMIASAQAGEYDELALGRGLPKEYRDKYFKADETRTLKIDPSLKKMITFKRFNLLNDYSSLGQFDIVFCRNVLIYFDGNQKNKILTKLAACLPQSGILFLGAAESISGSESLFKMTSGDSGLYYSKL